MRAWKILVVTLGVAVACGPTQKVKNNGEVPVEFQVEQPDDQDAYYAFEALALQGYYFVPQALDDPEIPGANAVPRRTIADQKKRWEKARGAAKATEGQNYALLLWYTPAPDGMDPKEARKLVKAQRKEALDVLRALGADPKASETTLHMLAAAEHGGGDKEKAAAAWDLLVKKFPQSRRVSSYQGLRNYLDLRAGRPLTYPIPELAGDTSAEMAYMAAWTKFRAGDRRDAADALTQAAMAWTNLAALTWLRFDVLIIFTRSGVDPTTAIAVVTELCSRDNADLPRMLSALADAYYGAGEYDASAAVWDKLIEGASPARVAELRALQALVHFQSFRPDKAAEAAIAAWAAVQQGGDQVDPQVKETVAKRIQDLATRYHSQYATTRDDRVFGAAQKLYATYLAIPGRPDADQVKGYAAKLDELAAKKPQPAESALDKDTIDVTVKVHREQAVGCYERALQRDPTLAGQVTVTFDVTQDGTVSEVAVEPAASGEGLGLVGACLVERVKAWRFPARMPKGITRVAYPFQFSPAVAQ